MKIKLGDIFIGDFPTSQKFGANPSMYKKFGLKGHNGHDWAIPTGNQIIAGHDGEVVRVQNDQNGYGIHVRLWNRNGKFATIYGHFQKANVRLGEKVVSGQLLGISDNTGFSTGSHLHFSVCKTNELGARINTDNGYGGWLNPWDKRIVEWDIKNLMEPVESVIPQPSYTETEMTEMRLERDDNWNLFKKCEKELNDERQESRELKEKIVNLKDQIKKLNDVMSDIAKEDRDSAISELEADKRLKEAEDLVLKLQGDIEVLQTKVNELTEALIESQVSENTGKGVNMTKPKKTVVWEAIKEPLRLLVLGLIPFLIAYFTDLDYTWAGALTVLLRTVDKYLHLKGKEENNETLTKGLARF